MSVTDAELQTGISANQLQITTKTNLENPPNQEQNLSNLQITGTSFAPSQAIWEDYSVLLQAKREEDFKNIVVVTKNSKTLKEEVAAAFITIIPQQSSIHI